MQALWRSRRTNLHTADRAVVGDILQISTESELDPVGISSLPLSCRCSRQARLYVMILTEEFHQFIQLSAV
jgi:hypothetical protein